MKIFNLINLSTCSFKSHVCLFHPGRLYANGRLYFASEKVGTNNDISQCKQLAIFAPFPHERSLNWFSRRYYSQNQDHGKFHEIYSLSTFHCKLYLSILILARYQIGLVSLSIPSTIYGWMNEVITFSQAGAVGILGCTLAGIAIFLIDYQRNTLYTAQINDQFTQMKVGYLTALGNKKEKLIPIKSSTYVQDPEFKISNDESNLIHSSLNLKYKLTLKHSFNPNKKLLLQAYGPATYSLIKEQQVE